MRRKWGVGLVLVLLGSGVTAMLGLHMLSVYERSRALRLQAEADLISVRAAQTVDSTSPGWLIALGIALGLIIVVLMVMLLGWLGPRVLQTHTSYGFAQSSWLEGGPALLTQMHLFLLWMLLSMQKTRHAAPFSTTPGLPGVDAATDATDDEERDESLWGNSWNENWDGLNFDALEWW